MGNEQSSPREAGAEINNGPGADKRPAFLRITTAPSVTATQAENVTATNTVTEARSVSPLSTQDWAWRMEFAPSEVSDDIDPEFFPLPDGDDESFADDELSYCEGLHAESTETVQDDRRDSAMYQDKRMSMPDREPSQPVPEDEGGMSPSDVEGMDECQEQPEGKSLDILSSREPEPAEDSIPDAEVQPDSCMSTESLDTNNVPDGQPEIKCLEEEQPEEPAEDSVNTSPDESKPVATEVEPCMSTEADEDAVQPESVDGQPEVEPRTCLEVEEEPEGSLDILIDVQEPADSVNTSPESKPVATEVEPCMSTEADEDAVQPESVDGQPEVEPRTCLEVEEEPEGSLDILIDVQEPADSVNTSPDESKPVATEVEPESLDTSIPPEESKPEFLDKSIPPDESKPVATILEVEPESLDTSIPPEESKPESLDKPIPPDESKPVATEVKPCTSTEADEYAVQPGSEDSTSENRENESKLNVAVLDPSSDGQPKVLEAGEVAGPMSPPEPANDRPATAHPHQTPVETSRPLTAPVEPRKTWPNRTPKVSKIPEPKKRGIFAIFGHKKPKESKPKSKIAKMYRRSSKQDPVEPPVQVTVEPVSQVTHSVLKERQSGKGKYALPSASLGIPTLLQSPKKHEWYQRRSATPQPSTPQLSTADGFQRRASVQHGPRAQLRTGIPQPKIFSYPNRNPPYRTQGSRIPVSAPVRVESLPEFVAELADTDVGRSEEITMRATSYPGMEWVPHVE